MTREVQYPRCGRKGALQSIHVDAPNVDVAARLALSHHIDSRPTPPPAGTSFGLVVITPPPYVPPQRRVLAHRNRRALTARRGRSKHPAARRTASTGRLAARIRPR